MSNAAAPSGTGHLTGFGSKSYRSYVLVVLTLVYTLNFIDRILISVVGRPIIDEFQLSNFEFGILSGLGFALFYTFLGIPIANLSERINRVRIIAVCVVLWSVATVLCGFTFGFLSLLGARLLVGVGEAGCTPPANSLISDYFKPTSRPTALGIYAMGVTAGGLLAQLFGGSLLKFVTWREAFMFVGAPGIIIGLLVLFTIKEPPRGYSDPPKAVPQPKASISEALKELLGKPTFWIMTAGATLAAFAGYALVGFQPLFIQYEKGFSAGDTAIIFMSIFALAGTVGTFLGGYLTEKFSHKSFYAPCWVPGIGLLLAAPTQVFAYFTGNLTVMYVAMMLGAMFQYFYLGAQYNIAQAVSSVRVRATAVAILLFICNLIGYGGGPPAFGLIADFFSNSFANTGEFAGQIGADCSLSDPAMSETMKVACLSVKAHGVQWANAVAASVFGLAGLCFLLCIKTFKSDTKTNDA